MHAESIFAATLAQEPPDFDRDARAYRTLLETSGSTYAQEALLRLAPPTPRTHMINHESGSYLFDTYGPGGLSKCKNYFNGGCYHGFVERALEVYGLHTMSVIIESCRGARTLSQARECTHGAGHAILLAYGYEHLDQAIAHCREAFAPNMRAVEDCDDGVFMENNFGGFDVPPSNRWFRSDEPLYPCTDSRISHDEEARRACLFLQTQATLQINKYPALAGSIPTVISFCNNRSDAVERDFCFLGLARQIQAQHITDTEAIERACATFPAERVANCLTHSAVSAYAFGSTGTATALCLHSETPSLCFFAIFERIDSTSERTRAGKNSACRRLPHEYVEACLVHMETSGQPAQHQ